MDIFENLKSLLPSSVKQLVLDRYAEPQRFYHTFAHIQALYDLYSTHQSLITHKTEFMLAILFHDIIYDPERTDNELKSIEVFINQNLDISQESTDLVVEMIKSTITHKSIEMVDLSKKSDLELFLDCDLAILGSDQDSYNQYAKDIRKEYKCFDDEHYRKGRKAVLKKLLEKKDLFYTSKMIPFFSECDKKAKINVAREIAGL